MASSNKGRIPSRLSRRRLLALASCATASSALASAVAVSSAGAAAASSAGAAAVLSASERLPAQPPIAALELRGVASLTAANARFRLLLPGGPHWRSELDGIVKLVSGGDETGIWRTVDGTGPIQVDLAEREVWTLLHWVLSGYWRDPAAPIDRSDGGRRLQLAGGSFRFEVDEAADGVLALRTINAPSPVTLEFRGARRLEGRWLPQQVVILGCGDLTELRLRSARRLSVDDGLFLAPPQRERGFRFHHDTPRELEVARADSGHLFVRPSLNGEELGWFLFDSGAGISLLSRELIQRYRLTEVGRTRVSGIGGSIGARTVHRCEALRLGPLEMQSINVVSYDPERSQATRLLGQPVVGVLGWDVLLRSAVELDLRDGRVWLHPSGDGAVPARFRHPLLLHWKVPWVKARYAPDGEGLFMLDTGAGSKGLFFPHDSVRRLDLLSRLDGESGVATGAGGSVAVRHSTLDWVEVGDHTSRSVPVRLSLEEDWEGDIHTLGILGGAVLQPFRVLIDYRLGEVGFIPRDQRPTLEA
jgi:predicted aspartyl protease